ncbi:myosin-11 [Spodoptera frugiperda]|uniref:Myosin-11 n=1 Tax=Spodoptera frugiperda TaxID=7108 RepID=A0A9R0D8W5_SPOFR|nr:myosin-11 [Spodoptera frugiperda]
MSFNIDDLLAGILSDGSDDSFFDDDVLGKKKPARKKSTPNLEKKSTLFDLKDTDKPKPVASTLDKKDSLFDIESKKSPTPFKRTVSKESIKFSQSEPKVKAGLDKLDTNKSPAKAKVSASADKLDILNELGGTRKESGKSIEKGKSSQSLLDDILGGPSVKSGGSTQTLRPVTAGKSQEFDFDSILGKSEAKTSVSSKSLPQKPPVKENVKEDREASAKKSKSAEDWLGIFQDKDDGNDDLEDEAGMPAWLVGGDSKKKKSEDKKSTKSEPVKEKPKPTPPKEERIEPDEPPPEVKKDNEVVEPLVKFTPPSAPSVLQGSTEDITAEGAALYMQQQESQIMVALQLKAQEEKLAAMQMRQKESQRVQREAALAQHVQLDAMLRRQAENRQQMQSIIAAHQERITQRIKALLGSENTDNEDIPNYSEEFHTAGDHKDPPHLREKKQLLQLVQSLQENHDKEIDLMETSYRRQLAFLEVSLNQCEERMKEESDKLVKYYSEKINWLEEHHHLYKKLTDENLTDLTERHKTENEMLRQQHLENVKVLQEHHAALMENVKTAVKQEQVLIQDSVTFSSDLKELVADVRENKVFCKELLDKVQSLSENTERKYEDSLQVRETHINEMLQQLKNERETIDAEKTENREAIKMLEARLKQMTSMLEEETAALKQKKMEFEFEKATFNKQTEFAKNILKKQDEEMKMLREDIQKEYQEKITKIDEEKAKAVKDSAALAREKSTIQNLKQELEKLKAELQAQLEDVSEERSKLNVEKQQLHMEEQRVMAKSRDLDLLAKSAMEKQTHADKKYSEAEFVQRKYEERIRRIQEHVVSLNSREKHVAREKVALSRERLQLHNERKQIESRQQCSLCKSSQNFPPYYEASYVLPDSFMDIPVTKDLRSSNTTNAMNAIEEEMSHLMGRNLNLRHSVGIGDLRHHVEEIHQGGDRQTKTLQSDNMQVDQGPFKDYMDPKFMMLRLDVQKVLSNLDQNKKEDGNFAVEDEIEEE